MTKESECPRRRFSGLACGTAGQPNGCLSSNDGVGKCFCVRHRICTPENKKTCPCRLASWLWGGGNQDEATYAGILGPTESISSFPEIRKYGSVNLLRTTTLYEKASAIVPSSWKMLVWVTLEKFWDHTALCLSSITVYEMASSHGPRSSEMLWESVSRKQLRKRFARFLREDICDFCRLFIIVSFCVMILILSK